ncbi:outer membrane beta-barrel protein [Alistipes sp.]|uniref:outer membrane beta-barrel protein n=1 Tax=Alistipes sp. TaxID=1872444 RepID=UPI0025C4847F|nr:outer membrane beta-barrel protein [Alistipes sp.]
MKKVLLIAAAILLASAASSQNYEKNILGVRAGLNLASYTLSAGGVSISTNSRASFHVAVTDQILLCRRLPFYLETGLAFSSRGGKVDNATFRPSYLQIPMLVNYHFNIKDIVTIQPFAGLYYGLGLGGKAKIGDKKSDIFGDNGELKRSDLGVRLGAGVVWKHIYFGLGYDIGCLNLAKYSDGGSMRNNCFTLSVGYNF